MLKLSKKGFTLVEVLCSLGIFSIIFISMISFDAGSLNMKKDIKSINNNVFIMEALKNNILYYMTFEQLEELEANKKFYINKENMTFNKMKVPVMDVFSDKVTTQNYYMQISFLKCEFKVHNLRLSLHSGKPNDIVELQCDFYKGCH